MRTSADAVDVARRGTGSAQVRGGAVAGIALA